MEAVSLGVESSPYACAWPEVRSLDQIKALFPKSLEELALYADRAIEELEAHFQRVMKTPIALRDFETVFYAIDFARALGNCRCNILQVVSVTHTLLNVRNKALECANKVRQSLAKFSGNKELYQACLFARSNRGETGEKIAIMEEMLVEFEREGAHLNMEEWAYCLRLKKEIRSIETAFLKNLDEDDTCVWILKSDLQGVSQKLIDSLEKRGEYCRVVCDTATYYGVVSYCDNERTRKRIYLAYNRRCHEKNLPLLRELIKKRNELAALLRYKSYAHFDISNQLAKTPEAVQEFLDKILAKAKPCAEKELDKLLNMVSGNFVNSRSKVEPWNIPYLYAIGRGQVCQEDDEELSQFFPFASSFPKMLAYLSSLLKLNLKPIYDSVWIGAPICVEVKDEGGALFGHILYDLFPRKGKYGHAVCYDVIPPLVEKGECKAALAVIVVNLSAPADASPNLLTLDELSTLLHETGHAIHLILGAYEMPTKSGYRTPTDFLEMPPILLENLLYEPGFLKAVSGHYLTEEPVKEAFLKNRRVSKNYALGHVLQLQAALAQLSLDLFYLKDAFDTTAVREQIYKRMVPSIALVDNLHYEATFRHIADPLYASKYYGFLYALAHSTEVYVKIQKNPSVEWYRFRKIVLERGGGGSPLEHLAQFLGKQASIELFLKELD